MSSTNRGYNRHKSDYYITPIKEIKKFLSELTKNNPTVFSGNILDCAAGGDDEHQMSYPIALKEYSDNITTLDIREDSLATIKTDYLEWASDKEYNTIITNPPFKLAEDIIKKALNDVSDGGHVIMLLRLNYFGTKKRNKWLLANMPNQCYIHSKRMSFTDDGGTDSIEYAHFVWAKGVNVDYTKTYLLEY